MRRTLLQEQCLRNEGIVSVWSLFASKNAAIVWILMRGTMQMAPTRAWLQLPVTLVPRDCAAHIGAGAVCAKWIGHLCMCGVSLDHRKPCVVRMRFPITGAVENNISLRAPPTRYGQMRALRNKPHVCR